MQPIDPADVKVDRVAFTVSTLDEEDPSIEYWACATPEERLRHMELLRRINYGDAATGRMEKVLTVVRRE